MVAGHMTKKNGYWYLILMVRDETGRLKQKWISTHLRVEGNKKKAEAMLLAARREYTDFAEIQKRSSDVLVSHYLGQELSWKSFIWHLRRIPELH